MSSHGVCVCIHHNTAQLLAELRDAVSDAEQRLSDRVAALSAIGSLHDSDDSAWEVVSKLFTVHC